MGTVRGVVENLYVNGNEDEFTISGGVYNIGVGVERVG